MSGYQSAGAELLNGGTQCPTNCSFSWVAATSRSAQSSSGEGVAMELEIAVLLNELSKLLG
jgi:hypothetical protein